jgi:hypothetical protein
LCRRSTRNGGAMRLVKHLLEGKGAAIFAIEPEQPVLAAIRMMAEKHVGALLVMRGAAVWRRPVFATS